MTPVPLDLPLRPSEAAEAATLIFDTADGHPLTGDLRARIAARAAALRLETVTPYWGGLARDPVHPGAYYLPVDGAAGVPLLLHMAPASAPTSGIFEKPVLIGRMPRARGGGIVINAVPFRPTDHERLERFAQRVDTAFHPRPQGSRASIVAPAEAGSFEFFRGILKRAGKNTAAVEGDFHRALFEAIRAGWREGYSAVTRMPSEPSVAEIRAAAIFTRVMVEASPRAASLPAQIRQARAALKLSRAFDWELTFAAAAAPTTPRELFVALDSLRAAGETPHFVAPRFSPDLSDLEEIASIALQYNATLSMEYGLGVEAIARATLGRVSVRVQRASDLSSAERALLLK